MKGFRRRARSQRVWNIGFGVNIASKPDVIDDGEIGFLIKDQSPVHLADAIVKMLATWVQNEFSVMPVRCQVMCVTEVKRCEAVHTGTAQTEQLRETF
jgi:glycogen synthase